MKIVILIFVIGAVHLLVLCGASKHTLGYNHHFGTHLAYERTLINDINDVPKNYTIIYKYLGAKYRQISYLEFDVNVESEGHVSSLDNNELIEAKIHINNALNVTAIIRIHRMGLYDIPEFDGAREYFETKSIAYVHKKNADSSRKRPLAQNAIGRRRDGDSLLHFESRNITNGSRFPSRAFEYSSSDYITYVGFSFNSPTAMVMINTSFVGEQEFNAVAYDMNTEHFVANVSIYGFKSEVRMHGFEGVI